MNHLQHWNVCTPLNLVRDANAVKKLPEAEQKEWLAIWAEVATLLKNVQEKAK